MEQRLIASIAAALGVPASTLSIDTQAQDVEQWDSLGLINIMSEIEMEFGVVIPVEDLGAIQCVRDLLPYVEKTR
jgi:acyl carrier protein